MDEAGRQRRRPRWSHATVSLEDVAVVGWTVDPDRLAALLPRPFEPVVRDGGGLVSVVAFRDRGFHFRAAPFVRMSGGQVDYRAHVRRGDETGVWFLGTSLDSRLVVVPRAVWGMPWHRTTISIEAAWADGEIGSWRLDADGRWGAATLRLRGVDPVGPAPRSIEPVANRLLLDPDVGWYAWAGGPGVGRCSVWHEPLDPRAAVVEAARFDVLTRLGLVAPDQQPATAGVQRRIDFDVHTPPTRLERT